MTHTLSLFLEVEHSCGRFFKSEYVLLSLMSFTCTNCQWKILEIKKLQIKFDILFNMNYIYKPFHLFQAKDFSSHQALFVEAPFLHHFRASPSS